MIFLPNSNIHQPVMLKEVLEVMDVKNKGIYIDGTFGVGCYSRAILEANPQNIVIAIDRDPEVEKYFRYLKEQYVERFMFYFGCFRNMGLFIKKVLGASKKVKGVCLDLGVSSLQLDKPYRGFSFRFKDFLDMRMNQKSLGPCAADIIANESERSLANIFWSLGQERHSKKIAKKIVKIRLKQSIKTTEQLVKIVHSIVLKKVFKNKKKSSDSFIDPATKIFQALRIYVNNEIEELEHGLTAAESVLENNGRLVVVSFHSLEDTVVKKFFREKSCLKNRLSRYIPEKLSKNYSYCPAFQLLFQKPLRPSKVEIQNNPRSSSARLRMGIKIGTLL